MWESINDTGTWEGEIWNRRKNGEIYPQHLSIATVKSCDGHVTHYVGTFSDITISKATAEESRNLAFYDPLTGLPNRRLLLDRLDQALASSARNGCMGALLFLDLDHFKTLNDSLGHDIGDLLLKEVAGRLRACVRESDTVASFGGDEFVVMLEELAEQPWEAGAQAEVIGNKILTMLDQTIRLDQHEYRNGSSIGIVLYNDHQECRDELLKHADIAMYQAKRSGRNTLRFFDPEIRKSIAARLELERELRKAFDSRQFQLHYQIQVNSLRRPVGAEVLIRWPQPGTRLDIADAIHSPGGRNRPDRVYRAMGAGIGLRPA